MNEEQLKYYHKGAYEVGLMFAMLIDRHVKDLENIAEQLYNRDDSRRGDDYICAANMLKTDVFKMLSGNIDEFREELNGAKNG